MLRSVLKSSVFLNFADSNIGTHRNSKRDREGDKFDDAKSWLTSMLCVYRERQISAREIIPSATF